MSTEELDKIAQDIGEVTTPRDNEHDKKESDEDVEVFDIEEYRRDLEEYEGGWGVGRSDEGGN